jgi:hypothetical protein
MARSYETFLIALMLLNLRVPGIFAHDVRRCYQGFGVTPALDVYGGFCSWQI